MCDEDEHKCYAPPGKTLVDSIKIYTASCNGCSAASEGVVIRLLGEKNGNYLNGVPCQSKNLDHKSTTDFGSGSAVFDGRISGQIDQEEKDMMGSCFEVRELSKKMPKRKLFREL